VHPAGRAAPLTVESLTKTLGAAALVAYGVGLIVVNAYLLRYEVSDFGLFRARFVLTGTLFLSAVAVATVCPLTAAIILVLTWRSEWLPVGSRKMSNFVRMDFTLVAAMLVAVPFAVFRYALGQAAADSAFLYFGAATLGGLGSLGGFILKAGGKPSSRAAQRSPGPRLPAWTSLPVLGLFFVPYLFLVMSRFATAVYPTVAEQLGGARPTDVTLLVEHDAVASVRALGVPLAEDGTARVRLLFHGEGFYVVEGSFGSVVLRADAVLGVARPAGI
jgi:hypothetical protein